MSHFVPQFLRRGVADVRLRVAQSYAESLGEVEHHAAAVLSNIQRYEVDGDTQYAEQAEHHCKIIIQKDEDATNVHNLVNKIIGRKQRFRFYPIAAELMVHLARKPQCRREFDEKTEFQERASQYHFASALGLLKAVGYYERAQEILDEVLAEDVALRGQNAIFWEKDNINHTPSITVGPRGVLETKPWWTDDARFLHIRERLLENHAKISEEIRTVIANRDALLPKAYERLTAAGDWEMVPVFNHKRFNPMICSALPVTSGVIKSLEAFHPDLPNIVYNSEEASIFRVTPGTRVQLHNGGTNTRVNLSLGLFGCEGSEIILGGAGSMPWKDGEIVAFDDGWDHAVTHTGPEDRWVLTLGLRHPDLLDNLHLFARAKGPRACVSPWRTEYEEISQLNQGRFKKMMQAQEA